jgi:transposase-like protein
MVRALRAELGTEHGTVHRVARQLGYGIESVRAWVRQADIDDGYIPGVSTVEAQRIKDLEQENRELKRANEILKRAASFFGAELCAMKAPGVSGGGERPSLLGRRSGLMKHRCSRSPGTTVMGGKRPREGEPCWYCQTVRAR